MTLCRSIAAYLFTYVFNLVTVCTGALWSMELDGVWCLDVVTEPSVYFYWTRIDW